MVSYDSIPMKKFAAVRRVPLAVWVFALALGVLEYFTLDGLDTIDFTYFYLQKCPDGFDFMGWLRYVNTERRVDNMRLFNMFAAMRYLYVPQLVYAVFFGFCCGLTLWLFGRYSAMRRGEGSMLFFVIWLLVAGLPWSDHLLIPMYTFNYTVPSTICLLGIWLTWRGTGRRRWAGAMLIVVASLAHEGLGVPLVCGAAFLWMVTGRWRRYRVFYAVMAVGTLLSVVMLCSSALTRRLGYAMPHAASLEMTPYWLFYNFLTFGLLFFLTVALCRRSGRAYLRRFVAEHPLGVFFFGCALGGLAIGAVVAFSPRTYFWSQMCSALVLTMLAVPVLRRHMKATRIAGLVLGVLFAAYAAWSVPQCRKFTDAYTAAIEELGRSESGTVFCRTVHPMDFPKYISRFPIRDIFFLPYSYEALPLHYGKPVAFVPEELADMPTDVEPDSLYRSPSGYYVFRPTDRRLADTTAVYAEAWYARGVTLEGDTMQVAYFLLPYIAPDGTRMVMISPTDVHPSLLRSIDLMPGT